MVTLSPRAGKWLLAALIVSLGLNLFVGGLIVGHKLNRHPHEWAERHQAETGQPRVFGFIDRMASTLPQDDREKFLKTIDGYRAELAEADKNFRGTRKKVQDAIAAEPFDRNALDMALADVQAKMGDLQKVLHRALSDAVSALPPDARKKLAAWGGHDDRSRDRDDRDGGKHEDER
jgi:uncharacterized membrane protein